MRQTVRESDIKTVKHIVGSTGFFTEAETEMAGELVETYLSQGEKSGYRFLFLEEGERTVGYACFGEISCAERRYDLYWIAVESGHQGKGYGKKLLEGVEKEIGRLGGEKIFIETSSRRQYLPTRQFYSARGYEIEAQLRDFYSWGDDKVIFSKTLSDAASKESGPKDRNRPLKIRRIQFRSMSG
ncbi:MAG: GNAT family N-acetyltransferase [bacterium]|nr:MAG: GNAT family N-acetyltransferase [bacterium]